MNKEKVLFLLLGVGQICYGLYASVQVSNGLLAIDIHNAIILLLFFMNLFIIYGFYQKRQRKQLEGKLRETKYLMQIEQLHYQVIEERRTQVAKIRHDFNNQLTAVQQLLWEQQEKYATELLNEIEMGVKQSAGIPYCAHPLVNMILNDKQQLFAREQIETIFNVSMQKDSFVDPQHLCSVFSNILQLVFQHVQKNSNIKKYIFLTAEESEEEFTLCCRMQGHFSEVDTKVFCYEEKILQEIAAYYKGLFEIKMRNGIAELYLVLYP